MFDHASNAGSRRSFRSPDPFLNPKMAPYIFGHRNKIHIVNLEKTLPSTTKRWLFVKKLPSNRGTILFVGTKRQAREIVAEEAPPAVRRASTSAGWAAC